jgi:phosphatidylglycerol:prolipoprotein diacylglycerol transferase
LGARLYYLIFDGGIQSFSEVIRFWEGGLAIYGGVIGGAVGLLICCLIKKVNIVSTTDATVPLLAIGQAFGRIGCIFGECCYGVEVDLKGLQFFPISIFVHGEYHYATNFYEAILDFVLFIVLNKVLRKCNIKGITTCAYLVGYGVIRFVLEFFRDKAQTLFIGAFPISQLVSLICITIGVVGIVTLLLVNNRKKNSIKTA